MKLGEIFENSLTFPAKDWTKLLILGVLLIIANIVTILPAIGVELKNYDVTGVLALIAAIISIIISLFLYGYYFSITKGTIHQIEGYPEFDFVKNIIDGLKILVVTIIYYLIPFIVTFLVAYFAGAFNQLNSIIELTITNGTISQSLVNDFAISFVLVFLVAAILFILFTLLLTIAIARFADTDEMMSAFEFGEIFNTIGEIGWGNYIVWYIVLFIIIVIIGIVSGLISIIPFLGIIIALLFIEPYMQIFTSRAVGLIYNEKDE